MSPRNLRSDGRCRPVGRGRRPDEPAAGVYEPHGPFDAVDGRDGWSGLGRVPEARGRVLVEGTIHIENTVRTGKSQNHYSYRLVRFPPLSTPGKPTTGSSFRLGRELTRSDPLPRFRPFGHATGSAAQKLGRSSQALRITPGAVDRWRRRAVSVGGGGLGRGRSTDLASWMPLRRHRVTGRVGTKIYQNKILLSKFPIIRIGRA